MLYPLSYEGLRTTFAQRAGLVSCRWARAGYLRPDGLCRIYAACRRPVFDHRPDTRRRLYGWWWRVILAGGGRRRLSSSPGSRSVLRRGGLSVVGHGFGTSTWALVVTVVTGSYCLASHPHRTALLFPVPAHRPACSSWWSVKGARRASRSDSAVGARPKFLDHGQVKLPLTRAESESGSLLLSTTVTCGNWVNGR
jgi:hypothetical protein